MRKLKTYEQHVKEKFPDAKCIGVGLKSANSDEEDSGVMWHMVIGADLGENYSDTKEEAWKNAYEKIKETTAV